MHLQAEGAGTGVGASPALAAFAPSLAPHGARRARRHEHWAAAHVAQSHPHGRRHGTNTAGATARDGLPPLGDPHASCGALARHAALSAVAASAHQRAPLPRAPARSRGSVLDRLAAAAALRPRVPPHGARELRAHYLNQAFEITARPPRTPPRTPARPPAPSRPPPREPASPRAVVLVPHDVVHSDADSGSASMSSSALSPGGRLASMVSRRQRSDVDTSESLRLLPGAALMLGMPSVSCVCAAVAVATEPCAR